MSFFHLSLRARITLAVTGLVLLLMLATALITLEQVTQEYTRILTSNKTTVLSTAPADFIAILQAARHQLLAAILIGTALVALLVTILVRLLTRPLTLLTRHMEELPDKSGDARYLNLAENGDIGKLVSTFNTMISELEQHCKAIQENEQVYRIVIESAADFTYWQLPDGSFKFISPACLDVTGYSREELRENPALLLDMVHPADQSVTATLRIVSEESCLASDEIEYRIITREGNVRWIRHAFRPIYDDGGTCLGRRGSNTDITERKQLAEQVSHLVLHDLLTGLPNRSLLIDRLSLALNQRNRSVTSFTVVLFFGIDRFKLINDTMGHDVGDRILIMTAERLSKMLNPGDTLCRFSGDVFAMILPERESRHEAITMSYQILAGLTEPFRLDNQQVNLTGSIGIAVSPEDGTDPDSLLKSAETAMYEAKRSGKNCFRFYAREMNFQAVQLLKLDNSMPTSLARGDFYLQFQPQLDLRTESVVAVEALLRWRHPELGMIPPDRFIPLAEENGFIIRLGSWVLKTACEQAAAWLKQDLPPLRMAVNISSRQFSEPDFVDLVASTLESCALNPDLLELELTESLLVSNEQQVLQKLQALKAMGIHLAIDDFGTGYSSLAYLKHFPLDRLKIDKSFVNDILNDPDDAAITEAIIVMAHSLKLKVIAEGVETREQLLFLEDRGCYEMQGYFLSRPLSEHDLVSFVKARLAP